MKYAQAFSDLMVLEEGSPEGKPPYGITQGAFSAWLEANNHPDQPVDSIPRDLAEKFCYESYWIPAGCAVMPNGLDFVVLQGAYNCGVEEAIRWLQASVGVSVDGIIGSVTLKAIASHPVRTTIVSFFHHQQDYYDAIVRRVPQDRRYADGWHNRILRTMSLLNQKQDLSIPPFSVLKKPDSHPIASGLTQTNGGVVKSQPAQAMRPDSSLEDINEVVKDEESIMSTLQVDSSGNVSLKSSGVSGSEKSLSSSASVSPKVIFFTKVATGFVAGGVWLWMVIKGYDKTTQQAEILLACKGWVVGLVTHLMTKKA